MRKRLSTESYIEGIRKGDRGILSQAITLVESHLPEDRERAEAVLVEVMKYAGNSVRIAITGVPGAGKSTLIEVFGQYLTGLGKKIAVLAVDPSSSITSGSILGDKTRMEELSRNPNAFIRPSPAGGSLSGIGKRTRETILLCEAAGFELIFIETVGVGQIETQVHEMVDFFLMVMLTGAGDELQMIKKGIMEMTDLIVVNKADGANKEKALLTQAELSKTLENFPEVSPGWTTKALTASSTERTGLKEIWEVVNQYVQVAQSSGYFQENRKRQNIQWMKESISELLNEDFYGSEKVKALLALTENEVAMGKTPPLIAAKKLFINFKSQS